MKYNQLQSATIIDRSTTTKEWVDVDRRCRKTQTVRWWCHRTWWAQTQAAYWWRCCREPWALWPVKMCGECAATRSFFLESTKTNSLDSFRVLWFFTITLSRFNIQRLLLSEFLILWHHYPWQAPMRKRLVTLSVQWNQVCFLQSFTRNTIG